MSTADQPKDDAAEQTMKELRYMHPTGWLHLMAESGEGLHLCVCEPPYGQ